MRLLLVFLALWCVAVNAEVRYDGYQVFRVTPKNERQVNLLRKFQETRHEFDFWSLTFGPNIPVDVMVAPAEQGPFFYVMRNNGMDVEVFIDNVQERINNEKAANIGRNMDWTNYQRLDDINAWLNTLVEQYPDVVTLVNAGKSFENRDIIGVKISYRTGNTGVFIEGGLHAREWISPATVTFLTNELLTSDDPTIRSIAESFDWYLFPVINTDGYEYSHTTDRLWRKTRRPYGECIGADPNRNFDFQWGGVGTSNSPCSNTFGGAHAFSEVEVAAMANFMTEIKNTQGMDVFLSVHSFSQLLLLPFGNTSAPLGNYEDVMQIGQKAIDALAVRYGTFYRVGGSAAILYATTGTSQDWSKDTLNIPIVYTYELRDRGQHGFVLPPDQILPNNLEFMDSIKAMFEEGENLGYFTLVKKQ